MQLSKGEIPKDMVFAEHLFTETTDFNPIGGATVQRASVVELIKARIADGTIAGGGGGAVSSVNTRTGAVVLDKTDVGLSAVNNTSDVAKPISTATQTALNLKQDTITLTTTGSGAATLVGSTLNIPTPAGGSTTNTLTGTGAAITSTVNGTAASITPSAGTIQDTLGFNSSGTLVKQAISGGGGSTISQYSAGANVLVTATNTGITATKSSGAWTITVPSGVIPLEVSIDVASTDVNVTGDASGATNWVTVNFSGSGIASGATTGTFRFPVLQTFLVPSTGSIATTNAITMSSTAIAVVGVAANSVTFRKANMVTTGEHTILTFTGF